MKKYTQADFEALTREEYGYLHIPTGDWTDVDFGGQNKLKFAPACILGGWVEQIDIILSGAKAEDGCILGDGCKIGTLCKFGRRSKLGDNCTISVGCSFAHDCTLGNGCVDECGEPYNKDEYEYDDDADPDD